MTLADFITIDITTDTSKDWSQFQLIGYWVYKLLKHDLILYLIDREKFLFCI